VGVDQSSRSWYALYTRSRCEKRVRALLEARGIESFLPLVERWRQWQDRRKLVAFPLFPGYCFAQFPRSQRATALSTPGVVQIIGNHDGPLPVPDGEIEAVRRLVTCTLPYDPHPYLDAGMAVEVVRGPLQGVRGVLIRKGSRARLVIRVTLIHQAASVELDAFDVKPAD
jgi:transcription antitermination factor NusG